MASNTPYLRLQNGPHFADDVLKRIFLNERVLFLNTISLKFVRKGLFDNNPALVNLDNGLAPNKRQAIILTNADPILWRI